ncbi:MAG TPA: hypothetical protein VD863_28405, partial [Bradyrhizobium sp.]|nr:hypothetical protein [Bradyrhizobium sp.]
MIALQIYLVSSKSINWDEFYYFSRIQELNDGRLAAALQTSYTRFFQFLPHLPGDAIDQLLIGRSIMLACELIAAAALFGIASRFGSARVALLCALTYLTAGYVFLHGSSFRADPLATALLMSALWCLCCRPIE